MTQEFLKSITVLLLLTTCGCAPRLPSHGVPLRIATQADASDITEIPLERYLVGVLEHEVSASWPLEALKAQAVASRTYALYKKEHPRDKRFDLMADTSDQVFRQGESHRRLANIIKAVRETEGQILTYDGKIFSTYFHSSCGGMSEDSNQVWPASGVPPLEEVHQDPYCSISPNAHWDYPVSQDGLYALLDPSGTLKEPLQIEIKKTDTSGRVQELLIASGRKHWKMSGVGFRKLLGNTNLKSTLFEISTMEDPLIFSGRGAGHGVGLCQWGAKGMADQGRGYEEILEFYYPGATLTAPLLQISNGLGQSLPSEIKDRGSSPAGTPKEEVPIPETAPETQRNTSEDDILESLTTDPNEPL